MTQLFQTFSKITVNFGTLIINVAFIRTKFLMVVITDIIISLMVVLYAVVNDGNTHSNNIGSPLDFLLLTVVAVMAGAVWTRNAICHGVNTVVSQVVINGVVIEEVLFGIVGNGGAVTSKGRRQLRIGVPEEIPLRGRNRSEDHRIVGQREETWIGGGGR